MGMRILRTAAAICILALGVGVFLLTVSANSAGNRDFIEYWAAGQQLIHGANPYDGAAIMRLERAQGYDPAQHGVLGSKIPHVSLSPPPILILVLPLGFIGARAGMLIWLFAILVCLVISIRMLWIWEGRPDNRVHLLGYLFAPVIVCLLAGQIDIFLLLGFMLFLHFYKTRPFVAGAALCIWTLKPHLFLIFGVILLIWILSRREYRILAGICSAVAACSIVVSSFDSHAWSEYLQLMDSSQTSANRVLHYFVPALSTVFRLLIDPNAIWLQFVPVIAGCIWALWYFWTRRSRWDWMDHGLLLMIVSVLCAPYAWFNDDAVLLPAVLVAAYCAEESDRSLLFFGIATGIAIIEAVVMKVDIGSPFYLWTTPAWLIWYLYGTGRIRLWRRNADESAVEA